MKHALIAIALTIGALPAIAQDAPPVGGPSTQWLTLVDAAERIVSLEKRCHGIVERSKIADYKTAELERKVAGMQKQITILHAKIKALEAKQ